MSLEERRALINLFPVMNVVPIPMAGRQYLLSCDNRRLHVYRSVLPEGTMVTVQNAPKRERKKLQWKWTSKNGGLYISVRGHRKGELMLVSFRHKLTFDLQADKEIRSCKVSREYSRFLVGVPRKQVSRGSMQIGLNEIVVERGNCR